MMAKLLTLCAALLLLGSIPKEEPGAIVQQPSLEGPWKLVSISYGAQKYTYTAYVFDVAKGKLTVLRNGRPDHQVILPSLHNGRPAGIHQYMLPSTGGKPRIIWGSMHGLFAVNGDSLIFALASSSDPWPEGIDAKSGAKIICHFKRAKPAP